MKDIVEDIKKKCSDLFSDVFLFQSINRTFIITGNNLSEALNNHNGELTEIKVLKWFDDFWIYVEINFIQQPIETKFPKGWDKKYYLETLDTKFLKISQNYFNVIISLSVFQGGYQKEEKKQLFRAEWDNYENNTIHPQPHWHFYPDENNNVEFPQIEIDDNFEFEIKKTVDLKRIHFAMNGQWAQDGECIHRISGTNEIVNWLSGTLRHIKSQLETTKSI